MQIPWLFPSHTVKRSPSQCVAREASGPQAAVYVAHREHTPLGTCGMARDAFGSSQALSSDPLPPPQTYLSIHHIQDWFTYGEVAWIYR